MLNRFTKISRVLPHLALLAVAMPAATRALMALPVPVVVTSIRPVATGFNGYNNKVAVDPFGNIFTVDSSNGRLWEIPAGGNSPVQIFLQNTASAIAATYPVTAVHLSSGGSGYTAAPTVTFSAPPSPCTVAVCTQAAGTAYISSAGVVTVVQMSGGAGYTSGPPTVTFSAPTSGTGVTATGAATLQPVIGLAGVHGVTTDQYGDVIVSSSTNGNLYFLPNRSGVLCTTCNAAGTAPLDLTGSYGFSTLDDYYVVISDIAIDNSGNLYVAVSHCNNGGTNACGTSQDSILLLTNITNKTTSATIAVAGTSNLFIGALPGGKAALNIAVDNNGHLFYADGVNAYVVSTSATPAVPVAIGTFTAPSGVSTDAAGNLYVVDNSKKLLYEIPNENGTLTPADQFVVAALSNGYYSVGFDPAGTIYVSDGTNKVVNAITVGALNAGASPVGNAAANATMNVRFNAAVTPTSFSVVQGNGAATEFATTAASTCVAGQAYAALGSCTLVVAFTPSSTGIRQGAIVVQGTGTKPIVTGNLSGTGTGAALNVDPGTQTALTPTTAFVKPSAIAMDAAGNVYVADTGTNSVQVISPAGTPIATVGTGLVKPGGVAVDGAGNVYISDTLNSQIVEVPNEGGTLNPADQSVVVSSSATAYGLKLLAPQGIAVDPNGGIYIADTGNTRVLRYTPFNGAFALVGSKYLAPVAVAVDNSGNAYIADQTANQVVIVNLATGAQNIALTGLSSPTSVAIDASNTLFVVNSSTSSVSRYPSVLGGSGVSFTSGLTTPTGIAVNGAGNVAISDSGAKAAYSLVRTAGTLNFGKINIGLSSTGQTVNLTSSGTSAITLGTPAYILSGTGTANYGGVQPVGTACTAGALLAAGTTCSYAFQLTPLVGSGTLTETLAFNSNAVNAASVSELLTGVATNLSLTNTLVSLASSASPIYGQAITVQATVSSQRVGYSPTGQVTFYLDGVPQSPSMTLSTAAPYTAKYTFGTTALNVATHVISASYLGDAANAGSNSATPLVVIPARQPSASAQMVTTSGQTAPIVVTQLSQLAGAPFYFNVTVSSTLAGSPTGAVTLIPAGGGAVLASATLSSSGTAQLSYTPPVGTAVGQYQYQVVYAGDSNFSGSTSNAVAIQIVTDNYAVSIPANAYSVISGQSVVIPITAIGYGGYPGNVTVGALDQTTTPATKIPFCAGLPANAVCIASPGIIAMAPSFYPTTNSSGVFNLTINTNVPPATPYPSGFPIWPACFVGLLGLALANRRRGGVLRARLTLAALAIALGGLTLGMSGCGSGSLYPTPLGTSKITLTFSGSPALGYPGANVVETLTFQLTVQPGVAQ